MKVITVIVPLLLIAALLVVGCGGGLTAEEYNSKGLDFHQ